MWYLECKCLLSNQDAYLIHWPGKQKLRANDPRNAELRGESWRALESLYDQGLCKSIGVCNYTEKHLIELISSCRIMPHLLQVEYHPLLLQSQLKALCTHHRIAFEAYSSLGEGFLVNERDDARLACLDIAASTHAVSRAQVLLRWAFETDSIVIPKTIYPSRMKQNLDIFSFTLFEKDYVLLNSLSSCWQKRFCWDPALVA